MRFLFQLILILFSLNAFTQNVDKPTFKKNVCAKYKSEKCDDYKTPQSDLLQISCKADLKNDGCDDYLEKISKGLNGKALTEVQDRVIGCSVKEICNSSAINSLIGKCAKGATYDLVMNILTLPLTAFEFASAAFEKDKQCFNDLAAKADLMEKFNLAVKDVKFQFPDEFFEGSYLQNLTCTELHKQIAHKKKLYQEAISKSVISGKITNPFEKSDLLHEMVLAGAKELGVKYNCLKPEVQAEFYCELAATAIAGPVLLSKLKGSSLAKYSLSEKMFLERTSRYKTISMRKIFVGEELGKKVYGNLFHPKYLTDIELAKFEIDVKGGKLVYKKSGEVVNTRGPHTSYVMDKDGRIYMGLPRQGAGEFHHSSYLAGGEVAAAGEINIVNGEVSKINRKSGHYLPSTKYLNQIIDELKNRGVHLQPNQINYILRHSDF